MTFASYQRVPTLMTYADALNKLNTTEPIRRRSPTLIPLGARKDCDKFSIQMADDTKNNSANISPETAPGSIDILFYGHPCVRYLKPLPDQPEHITRVQLLPKAHGWGTTEGWVLWTLLNRVVRSTQATRNHLKIFDPKSNVLVVPTPASDPRMPNFGGPPPAVILRIDTQALTIERDTTNGEPPASHTWRINRKQANNVRQTYGQFYRYAKGMIAVRKEQLSSPWAAANAEPLNVISFTDAELLDPAIKHITTLRWSSRLDRKPTVNSELHGAWSTRMTGLLSLILPHPDEDIQAQNFAHAFAIVASLCTTLQRRPDGAALVETKSIPKKIDELLFKWHSNTVFDRVPVPANTVPSTTYNLWVDRHE